MATRAAKNSQVIVVGHACTLSFFNNQEWYGWLMRCLRWPRSRVRSPVISHPFFNFCVALTSFRACLHGGGGPQIGKVTCGGPLHLSCKRDQIKMRDYMDRRVTSPTWGPPSPCKQALKYPWIGAFIERRGGGGVRWAHCRPQVCKLLLSRVIDVKYCCFTTVAILPFIQQFSSVELYFCCSCRGLRPPGWPALF